MSKFYDNLMKEIGVGKPARNDGIIYKRFPSSRTGKFTEEEMEYLTTNQIPYQYEKSNKGKNNKNN